MYGKCFVCEQNLLQAGGYADLGMCGVCATGEADATGMITANCPKCHRMCEYVAGAVVLCYACKNAPKQPEPKPGKRAK